MALHSIKATLEAVCRAVEEGLMGQSVQLAPDEFFLTAARASGFVSSVVRSYQPGQAVPCMSVIDGVPTLALFDRSASRHPCQFGTLEDAHEVQVLDDRGRVVEH